MCGCIGVRCVLNVSVLVWVSVGLYECMLCIGCVRVYWCMLNGYLVCAH